MDDKELAGRFTYHPPKNDQATRYEKLRFNGLNLVDMINELVPDSREKSLAITHLEQAVMWANAAIARNE